MEYDRVTSTFCDRGCQLMMLMMMNDSN